MNDRNIVAVKIILRKKFTDFHFDQFEDFRVINQIALVHENNKLWHANLTGEQDVLARLWHWAISCRHNEDAAIHLRRTRDHVLHIVSMAWAIDVSIVTVSGFIFDVCGRNGDAACALFRRLIDVVIAREGCAAGFGQHLRNRCGQRCLTMIDVPDGADVAVRFCPLKLCLCHCFSPSCSNSDSCA